MGEGEGDGNGEGEGEGEGDGNGDSEGSIRENKFDLACSGSDFIAILSDWAGLAIVKRVVCRRCGGAVLPLADRAQRARALGDMLKVLVEAAIGDFEVRAGGAR